MLHLSLVAFALTCDVRLLRMKQRRVVPKTISSVIQPSGQVARSPLAQAEKDLNERVRVFGLTLPASLVNSGEEDARSQKEKSRGKHRAVSLPSNGERGLTDGLLYLFNATQLLEKYTCEQHDEAEMIGRALTAVYCA